MKIQLDFENQRQVFENPIKVLQTNDLTKIEPIMHELERYTQQGYYVAGYLAYESSQAFNSFNITKDAANNQLPLLLFGVFEKAYITSALPNRVDSQQIQLAELISNTTQEEYNANIKVIHQQIKQGNTYQINYTIQFTSQLSDELGCNPYAYYQFLQTHNRANYCTYIEFDDLHILSISPELFFKLENNQITTKPMKGTSARGKNNLEDKQQLAELLSEKNQAENMMIVDLLRNDLSRISQTGTVKVTKLFEAEKYPTVWQLTSTIQSELKPNTNVFNIFQALFPCGSITGAPKASSMKIIAELEKQNREVYCGTIGYLAPYNQKGLFNIPIRTLTIKNDKACYGVGGGITWDSTESNEYDEVLAKTAILSRQAKLPDYLIETLLLDNGRYFLLDEHLARLAGSAHYFDFTFNPSDLTSKLQEMAKLNSEGLYKVRITLNIRGELTIEVNEQRQLIQINTLLLAPNAVNSDNVYLYHKTASREHFQRIKAGEEYLCYNQKGEITEFVNGNVALFIDNQWLTPKLESGLLAGTMRAHLLKQGKIAEKTMSLTDVYKADKISFINSVRGWIEIETTILQRLKQKIRANERKDNGSQ